jgi:hypothetical protein
MFCSQFTFLKESCILDIFKIKIDSTNFVFLMLNKIGKDIGYRIYILFQFFAVI